MTENYSGGQQTESPEYTDASELPSVDDLIHDLQPLESTSKQNQATYQELLNQEYVERQTAYIQLTALKDHFELKKSWSTYVRNTLFFTIGFQSFLLVFVGFGWFDFSAYEWLLPTLLIQTLAQVIALAVIVVKALFSKDSPAN